MKNVLVTGGAGYIGSMLVGALLQKGYNVTVLDDLLFGGESLLAYFSYPSFTFYKENVTETDSIEKYFKGQDCLIHLAAIVGFPACQQVGEKVSWLYNYEATKNVFDLAEKNDVKKFIFSSTYSNYGIAKDNELVTEESPLHPQSLYAKTKVKAEQYLLSRGDASVCMPIIFRFATGYGISPRTRFDLIVNQFVLEALTRGKLVIYQRSYNRSFVHIKDIVKAICIVIDADEKIVRNQIFNVGTEKGNYSKIEIIEMIKEKIPHLIVEYKDLTFGEDMRDVRVSFQKIENTLGYRAEITLREGIDEIYNAITRGIIKEPTSSKYRNHQFIVQ